LSNTPDFITLVNMQNPIRVLIAKPGLDGHDRGAKVVARGLRDAGFEVIYTGLHQTPEMVVQAALQEDVDVVGLSILSGAHLPLVKAIQAKMKDQGVDKPIFVGGIIPPDDARQLMTGGVAAVFGPGTPLVDIVTKVKEIVNG
jgi:methylmalonyl-CoA mutase, C-terminal domain